MSISRPISIKRIENTHQSREEIKKHGIKYFSRISAVGESTPGIFKAIARCDRSRMIYKLQFDP